MRKELEIPLRAFVQKCLPLEVNLAEINVEIEKDGITNTVELKVVKIGRNFIFLLKDFISYYSSLSIPDFEEYKGKEYFILTNDNANIIGIIEEKLFSDYYFEDYLNKKKKREKFFKMDNETLEVIEKKEPVPM